MNFGTHTRRILRSSVLRKQIVAVTGLAMVGFLVAHLSGNLIIYRGPEAFNGYTVWVAGFGPLLWVMRFGLIAAFVVHVWLTLTLVGENRAARGRGYEVDAPKGRRSFAANTMMYTGILVAAFLMLHLYDFTFANKSGPQSVVPAIEADVSQGLFGLVWNSFGAAPWGPVRTLIYVAAMAGVGLHVSHAIQSVFQTFGLNHAKYFPLVRMGSVIIGAAIAAGFALIPIYVLLAPRPLGY